MFFHGRAFEVRFARVWLFGVLSFAFAGFPLAGVSSRAHGFWTQTQVAANKTTCFFARAWILDIAAVRSFDGLIWMGPHVLSLSASVQMLSVERRNMRLNVDGGTMVVPLPTV